MKILGRHLIAEFCDCDRTVLNDAGLLEQYMKEAVRLSGATMVQSVFHRYSPQGVSGVVVIAESHFSVHTWPEYGYAAVDFFTCGATVNPHKAFQYLARQLESRSAQVKQINRGMPSEADEVIEHKPAESAVIGMASET